MSEDTPFPITSLHEPPELTHTAVRDHYVGDPNAHPGLLAAMDRLAATEREPWEHESLPSAVGATALGEQEAGIEEAETPDNMTTDGEKLKKYLADLKNTLGHLNHDGELDYELWNFVRMPYVRQALKRGDYEFTELNDLVGGFISCQGSRDAADAQLDVAQLCSYVPAHILRAAYRTKGTNNAPSAVNLAIQNCCESDCIATDTAECLARVYDLEDVLSLKDRKGSHRLDQNVQKLTLAPDFAKCALDADVPFYSAERAALKDRGSGAARDWAERYLTAVGLPEYLRDDLLFAAHGRTSDDDGRVDYTKFRTMLAFAQDNVRRLGLENTKVLRDKAGIVNLDYYSKDQLQLMADLVRGDPDVVKHLQAGDVTVVFTDAKGDHNGAFSEKNNLYRTPSGRTLFFEVNKRSDFNRYRVMLKQLGIKASTLVLAAHGDPVMGMGYGAKHQGFSVAAQADDLRHDLSLADLKTLPSILDDMMQDSRGIDDNEEAKGRRRIILDSCSQEARKQWVQRILPDGRMSIGVESTAESLARTTADPRLDVIAVDAVMGTKKTAYGMQVVKFPNPETNETVPWEATRLVVSRDGELHAIRTTSIELRRGAPPSKATRISVRPSNADLIKLR